VMTLLSHKDVDRRGGDDMKCVHGTSFGRGGDRGLGNGTGKWNVPNLE